MIKLKVRAPRRWEGEVPKGIDKEVLQMLEAIGASGVFKLKINKRVAGSSHTKGVKAIQASSKAILLHIQPGDNSTRYSAWLALPPDVNSRAMFEKMRFGEGLEEKKLVGGKAMKEKLVEERPAEKKLDTELPPVQIESNGVKPNINADLLVDDAPQNPAKIRSFVEDEEQVAVALICFQEKAGMGSISRSDCSQAIGKGCGLEKHSVAPIIGALARHGYLQRQGQGTQIQYQLTQKGLELIMKYQSAATQTLLSPSQSISSSGLDLPELYKLHGIEEKVKNYSFAKKRLAEIQKAKTELEAEEKKLQEALADPKIEQTLKAWEQIRQLLAKL